MGFVVEKKKKLKTESSSHLEADIYTRVSNGILGVSSIVYVNPSLVRADLHKDGSHDLA